MLGVTAPEGTEALYIALKFYKQIPDTVDVEFIFTLVQNLEAFVEVHHMYTIDLHNYT